ncbi:MAG: radical SAM protein [Peptococcaceae bacterium]|jgi:pyruvate formate lyase activating enzyme|nr:radical SAM protein [Peptococcaceae bacterium]
MLETVAQQAGCLDCGFCRYFVQCPGPSGCLGCGICIKGCPAGVRFLRADGRARPSVRLTIDGRAFAVPGRITVQKALELCGAAGPRQGCAHACRSGGCYECAVVVDGRVVAGCHTAVREGMAITTAPEETAAHAPLRLVSVFPGHLHAAVSLFTHGCNFGCAFCHNWDVTFSSSGRPVTPQELVRCLGRLPGADRQPRIAVSGGEPTLNRPWLIEFVRAVTREHQGVRLQVDTNGSLLTADYVDELREAGMTDISIDIKAARVDTFLGVTGLEDRERAGRYLETAWRAVEYIATAHRDRLYLVVGIPYHPRFISREEVAEIGEKLSSFHDRMDVNLIEYQPAFRMAGEADLPPGEPEEVRAVLEDAGLKKVWLQAGDHVPRATDPLDLLTGAGETADSSW